MGIVYVKRQQVTTFRSSDGVDVDQSEQLQSNTVYALSESTLRELSN